MRGVYVPMPGHELDPPETPFDTPGPAEGRGFARLSHRDEWSLLLRHAEEGRIYDDCPFSWGRTSLWILEKRFCAHPPLGRWPPGAVPDLDGPWMPPAPYPPSRDPRFAVLRDPVAQPLPTHQLVAMLRDEHAASSLAETIAATEGMRVVVGRLLSESSRH